MEPSEVGGGAPRRHPPEDGGAPRRHPPEDGGAPRRHPPEDGGAPRRLPPEDSRARARQRVTQAPLPLDAHVHTDQSPDSRVPIDVYAALALDQGLSEIAITDHVDFDRRDPAYG